MKILICFLFLSVTNSIFIIVPKNDKKCISPINIKNSLNFSFTVLGYMRDKYSIQILDNKFNVLQEIKNKENGNVYLSDKYIDAYICLIGSNKRDLKISFDFNVDNTEQHVDVNSIDTLTNAVIQMSQTLSKIDTNIKKSGANRFSYAAMTHKTIWNIKLFTSIKICLLIIFSILQVFMITNTIQNVKVTRKIEFTRKAESTDFL